MKTIMLMLVALCASFQVMALDYTVIPAGTIKDGAYPDYDFDYCNRDKAQDGQCSLLQQSDNTKWVTFRSSGGEQCEGGFYGYINLDTHKGYMVDGEFTCGHPGMKLQIMKDTTTGKYVYGVYVDGQFMGVEPLL